MKKIKSLAIIILMIATLIILSSKAEATTGKVNTETVRLRKEPNTKSTILDQLDKNDEVEILEEAEGWYKVTVEKEGEKVTGYISEKLVDVEEEQTSTKPEENSTTTKPTEEPETNGEEDNNNVPVEEPTADTSNNIEENKEYTLQQGIEIKILPLMSSREKAQISSGKVKVVEIINDWCKIENETENGWIRINLLKKSTSSEEPTQEPVEQPTTVEPVKETEEPDKKPETSEQSEKVIKTAYVSSDGLRVRKEPSTDSEAIDSLSKNTKVSILEELDGWYKIKNNGEIGYVSSKYISDTKVVETTSRGGDISRIENKEGTVQEETQEEPKQVTGTDGTAVVEYAKQYLGYKYVAGGASPSGFDCSGFTTYVYKQFGVILNRSSKDQIKNGVAVDRANLQPGDLVLFKGSSGSQIGHVGIYIGGGDFIHASNPTGGVKITALSSSYYNTRYVGARRVI